MPLPPATISDEVSIALNNVGDAATGIFTPTLRLGVTGLARAGKTIYITSLIHNLLTNAKMPEFEAMAQGRLIGAKLVEHPNKAIPRFAYEQHLADLTNNTPKWPKSTNRISQIRIKLKYQSKDWLKSRLGAKNGLSELNIDIIDYPGEWLLDLPLLSLSFEQFSEQALKRASQASSKNQAKDFLVALKKIDANKEANETDAQILSDSFKQYLTDSRKDGLALSTLPPGRFLLPGDMLDSPALTFSPLTLQEKSNRDSLYAMFKRRYEAYKTHVIRPFFRDHFARLDRQIILIDALQALNAGASATLDLQSALSETLSCFRIGSNNFISHIIAKKIDKIAIAATKADHLHHTSHQQLAAIVNSLAANATKNAKFSGAEVKAFALASIRTTSEETRIEEGEKLNMIVGTPQKGEKLDDQTFDGKSEIALFPGDLPKKPESIFDDKTNDIELNFLRFLPQKKLKLNKNGEVILPQIRLDQTLEYLIGDWIK